MTRLVRIAVAGLLVLGTVGAAAAGPATDHVHESIDAVLKVLDGSRLEDEREHGRAPARDPDRGE